MPPRVRHTQPRIHFAHSDAALCSIDDGALAGLRHRTVIDRCGGAAALALWQEEHLPGFSVPLHTHDCEEIITILRGSIVAILGEKRVDVRAGESVLIPKGDPHGFEVSSRGPVKLLAIFASSNPRVFRVDGTEAPPPWEANGSANQFDSDSRKAGRRK